VPAWAPGVWDWGEAVMAGIAISQAGRKQAVASLGPAIGGTYDVVLVAVVGRSC
jgi:hypothetical protein